jgi:hypothetical protein
MRRTNSLWALMALCLLVVPASSDSMPDYKDLGYGNGTNTICLTNLSEGLESMTAGQLKEIRLPNMEGFGKFIPWHWEKLGPDGTNGSDNTDLAKLIARRLIKQIEVMQPQASAWLLLMSGLMPEPWESVLLSITNRLILRPYAYKL